MPVKFKTIDEYLASAKPEQRAALERLRKAIKTIAPDAEECISYGIPAFRWQGVVVAGFIAAAKHCSYFPMSGSIVKACAKDLKDFDTSPGTIRFQIDKPLSTALVRKLMKARLAEGLASSKDAKTKPAKSATKSNGVAAYMAKLKHPLKPVLEEMRKLILGVDPKITEDIKWNAPSFWYKEYFATAGMQSDDFVRVVFHTGAKVKDNSKAMKILDPGELLEWHAKDRCSAKFHDLKDLNSKSSGLRDIVKQWIKQM